MDLETSPEAEALAADLRALIAEEAPKIRLRSGTRLMDTPEEWEAWKRWSARLYEKGFAGRSWPVEYGGVEGASPIEDYTVGMELAAARVLPPLYLAAYAAHAIISFGTDEQKKRFLQKTRDSEIVWCQLFSEPAGGSDLAALRTRAERRGDVYVINGQKVWNTWAQIADYGFLLARTSSEGKKHAGITAFLVDMKQVGVAVRPIREITGTDEFNEVFFTDVEIPVANRLGEDGEGWKVARAALAKERINSATFGAATSNAMNDLIETARGMIQRDGGLPDGYRQKLVDLYASCRVSNLLGLAIASREQAGEPRDADPPTAKLIFSETNLAVASLALDLLGEESLYWESDPEAPAHGRWSDMFFYARAYTLGGGSSEIQRNILSERVLGMPRD